MPISTLFLRMSVSYAMFKWMDIEKYAVGLVQANPLGQNDLRAWMRVSGLGPRARDINLEQSASELNACIPRLCQAEEQQLPDEVLKQTTYLTDNGIVHNSQARLMSKLAFCLRPNIGVPFSQLVHRGPWLSLWIVIIRHHDYPDFIDECVFRRRDADKYLWILGKLPIGVINN